MTYHHQRTTLRRRLISSGMLLALEAMEFAEKHHTGSRLDGSPEFSHQLSMAEMLLDIDGLPQPDETLAVCFLHDVREDHGVRDDTLRVRFGDVVADAVALLTKTVGEASANPFSKVARSAIASVVKGVDRIHNLGTMNGAFSLAKQRQYHAETQAMIRPMLVAAYQQHRCRRPALTHILSGLDRLSSPVDHLVDA